MKKSILFISLIFAMMGSIAQQDAAQPLLVMESLTMHSRILNCDIHFSVCLPDDYYASKSKKYPVTYLLHGLGDDETGWLEYGNIRSLSNRLITAGDAVPMIFIMPEAFKTYYVNDYAGTFNYEDMFIKELVPTIDSMFRTKNENSQRALCGYSMGGFGAMMLYLKHQDVFGVSVPLSMSVRSDGQYITEEAPGWDDQWGRLFGVPGLKGEERITDYYKQNSPFHFLQTLTAEQKKKTNIYMLNGDDEETLCRSNEELHNLMNRLSVPHEYRVVNGGHSFKVWREAMPNALKYISNCFEGKPYGGDRILSGAKETVFEKGKVTSASYSAYQCADKTTKEISGLRVYVPAEYKISNRNFPVIIITSKLEQDQQEKIAQMIYTNPMVVDNCPLILAFIPGEGIEKLPEIYDLLKDDLRIRDGYKYRSLISLNGNGFIALKQLLSSPFNTIVMCDNTITPQEAESIAMTADNESFNRLRIFIDTPAKGKFAEGNGTLHMLLRDNDHSHEYRVREGEGGFEWMNHGLKESLEYIIVNFHR